MARATASVRTGSAERPCTWQPGDRRFVCGTEPWAFIGPLAGYAAGKPVSCIWMCPQPGGGTNVLRWTDVRFGARVEGRLVLLDGVGSGAEVRLRVLADGAQIATGRTRESREIAEFEADLEAGPATGELQLELHADEHHWRHACVELAMTGKRPRPAGVRPAHDVAPKLREPAAVHSPAREPRPAGLGRGRALGLPRGLRAPAPQAPNGARP